MVFLPRMGGISHFQVNLGQRGKTGVMHKASWSTSHIYYFHCLTPALTSPNKPGISIHTMFTWQKSGMRLTVLCASFLFFLWWLLFICQPDSAMGCQDSSGCVHEGIFKIRLISKSIDWIKHISLPNVGGPHPISWRSEQNKILTLLPARGTSPACPHGLGHQSFTAFGLKPKHQILLAFWAGAYTTKLPVLRPSVSDWNNTADSLVAGWLRTLGLLSLHNSMSQLLINLVASLENPNAP